MSHILSLRLLITFRLFAAFPGQHSTYWGQGLGLTRFCFVSGTVGSQSWLEPLVKGLSRNSKNTGKIEEMWLRDRTAQEIVMRDSMTSIGWKSNTFHGILLQSVNCGFNFVSPLLVVVVHCCPKIVLNQSVGPLYSDSTAQKQIQLYISH